MTNQITIANPFLDRNYPIIQRFGETELDYSDYGLIGHNGYDFKCPVGTRIYASCAGIVTKVDFEEKGYGYYVRITTPWGRVICAHLSEQCVQVGQHVNPGDFIGRSGNTGFSTTPHLHLEVRFNGLEKNGYNGGIDFAPYTDGWLDGSAGGSVQPLPTEQPAPVDLPTLGKCDLPTVAQYEICSDIGLNIRSLPDAISEDLGDLALGRKINVVTEHEESGNHWFGFVVWAAAQHSGTELARKVE